MKIKILTAIAFLSVVIFSCNVEDVVSNLANGKITAKEKLGEVMNLAKTQFAADAKLAAIYGSQISDQGEANLLDTKNFSNFVYVVQSDSLQANELYVPVYAAGPIKSPVNFETMLSFVKDSSAKSILSSVFQTLATVNIDPSVSYSDSPDVLTMLLPRTDVKTFRVNNPTAKTDMFLLPGKSLDSTRTVNSADWVVNFHSDSSSLVLWVNSVSGEVINLSNI